MVSTISLERSLPRIGEALVREPTSEMIYSVSGRGRGDSQGY